MLIYLLECWPCAPYPVLVDQTNQQVDVYAKHLLRD